MINIHTWFIPAFVKYVPSPFLGITEEEGTNLCPCDEKKSMNVERTCRDVHAALLLWPHNIQGFDLQ